MASWNPNSLRDLWLGLACVAAVGCNADPPDEPSARPPSVVEATRVISAPFAEQIEVVGQLTAAESVRIRSEVAGTIESFSFEEGSEVEKGQILFVLDSQEQEAALRFAEANLVLAADIYERTKKLSKVAISAISDLNQSRAKVAAAEAAVDLARIALARTQIRAPFRGAVGARWVSPGARIDPEIDLVQLDAIEQLVLQFSLPENAIAFVRPGLRVKARVNAGEGEFFEAEVYFVSPTLDPSSRRLPAKAWVSNEDHRLRAGVFARVLLEGARTEDALFVAEAAVAYDIEGAFVWRITQDQKVERVGVKLGARRRGSVVIQGGVTAGDSVVTGGTHKLFGGETVEIRPADVALAN